MTNPDVSCRREPDGASLFNPDTNDSVATNAMGYLIWQVLARPRSQEEVVAHLLATCEDAPVEQVTADVAAFLQSLQPGGFIGVVLDEESRFYEATMAKQHSPAESALAHAPHDQEHLCSLGLARDRFYHGSSMLSAFRPGDYLAIEPAPLTAIRPGDVVVYRGREEAGESKEIVHRVVAVTPGGLVTRGDNNPGVDAEPVTQDSLLGRVTHRERKGRVRSVRGGWRGLLRVRALRAWRAAQRLGWQSLRIVGRRPYGWLRESGLVRRWWRPAIIQVCVETEDSPVIKYLHRRRTVAWWWPARGSFLCRKPYDLVIPRPGRRHPFE
jgi:signal peptidase I